MQLLCRNDVENFDAWKAVFDADAEAHRDAGLTLMQIWRDVDSRKRVFFLFEVNDRDKADAFMNASDAKLHAKRAGVTAGSYHFIETI